ncbi:MAG: putative glycoside hydrolase [Clostridiales bacterium]|jgi:hypothetical protein|nr:putative glycoside hydrolase [Clostridiales bacterium]
MIRKAITVLSASVMLTLASCVNKGENKPLTTPNPTPPVITATPSPTPSPTPIPTPSPKPTPIPAKGLYISATIAGSRYFDSRFELTKTTDINALVIDVKDEFGTITFKGQEQFDSLELSEAYIPDINTLITRLDEAGVYKIARIVCFKDDGITRIHPDYALKMPDGSVYKEKASGGEFMWIDPYNRTAWEYLGDVAEMAAKIGFDEIQLDYVRLPTSNGAGRIEYPIEENQSRADIFIEFGKYMKERLSPYDVALAADVFAGVIYSDIDAELIGQNYTELAKVYDVLCPMTYPSHYADNTLGIEHPDLSPYETVLETLKISNEKLDAEKKAGAEVANIRPWLQDFSATWLNFWQPYGGEQLSDQIRAATDCGINEYMLWDPKNNFDGFRELVGQPYE